MSHEELEQNQMAPMIASDGIARIALRCQIQIQSEIFRLKTSANIGSYLAGSFTCRFP